MVDEDNQFFIDSDDEEENSVKDPLRTNGSPPVVQEKQNDLKISFAGVAGNILEWYDFATFGYFSDIISENFFPSEEGNAALIATFAVFGAAFLVRPIGAAFIGRIGDSKGRKGALETSIFLMAFPTFALGCLPTFHQVGWLSTFLLVILRLLQGLSVGGQLMASVVFTLERTHFSKWGFWGSTVYAASSIGVTLGSIFSAILREYLTDDELRTWGWRIPFLFGAFGALPGAYLRLRAKEQPVVPKAMTKKKSKREETNNEPRDPIKETFSKNNRKALVSAALIPTVSASAYYVIFVWLVIYMSSMLDPPIPHAFAINSVVGIIGGIFFTLFGGWFADFVGNYSIIMLASAVLLGVLSPVLIGLIGYGHNDAGRMALVLIIQLFLSLILSLWGGAMLPWMIMKFPPEIRLTSASIAYNVAVGIWGGFSPAIATVLVDRVNSFAPGLLVTVTAYISLCGWYIAPATNTTHWVTDDNDWDDGEVSEHEGNDGDIELK